jgi:uncharacterized membrane protein YtjA (UPF0391 family)
MLKWSFAFLIIALIAGAMGFTGVAGAATTVAQTLFFVFIALWLIVIAAAAFIIKK